MQPKEFHEAANIFPLDEEHLQELADDIATNGLWTPIELYHGLILDGRRRYKACQLAKVEPDYTYVCPPDPVAYVWSLNKHRRHMSTSDLGMAGARMRDLYEKYRREGEEKMRAGKGENDSGGRGKKKNPEVARPQGFRAPQSRDKVGAVVGVSGVTVSRAQRVIANGTPELVEAVDTGKVSVNAASKIAKLPKDEQPDALKAHLESPRKPSKAKKNQPQGNDGQRKAGLSLPPGKAEKLRAQLRELRKLLSVSQIQLSPIHMRACMDEIEAIVF